MSDLIWGTENPHAYIKKPTHPKLVTVWGILATFGFSRTTLLATHPKLHLMFCFVFLKLALSAAELLSFGHLEVVI